jgi:8-oxo-dGTP diphosphatase
MSEEKRFKFYGAVYLVLVKDGKVLLLRRFNTGYNDGNYSLVAGHLDNGETTKQGIIREAKEEAGITVKPEDLEVVHVVHRNGVDRYYFDTYLRASEWSGEITNTEPEKCDDLKWFSFGELPENIVPEVKSALEHINNNIPFSEFGFKDNQ